jgi:hypothetical protein
MGFQPTIPMQGGVKTVHILDRAATVSGSTFLCLINYVQCHEDVLKSAGIAPPFSLTTLDRLKMGTEISSYA